MGENFHTAFEDSVHSLKAADMNGPLSQLDEAISFLKNVMVGCDGEISWVPATGKLVWEGFLRFTFIRKSDGYTIRNKAAAGEVTVLDNYFAYVDLSDTDDATVTVQTAAISTGSESNFKAVNRIVLGMRNAVSDEFYPVALAAAWSALLAGGTGVIEETISLVPEYPGAVLTKSGSNNDPGGEGMTSDVSAVGDTYLTYYEWSSDVSGALQSYDVFIQWRVPETFVGFQTGVNEAMQIKIATEETPATNNKIDITIQRQGAAGTSSLTAQTSDVAATFKTIGFDDADAVLGVLLAGELLNIRVRLYSFNSKWARVGRIDLNVRRQWPGAVIGS